MAPGERVQKVLAAAGVASRRAVEVMLAEGRIAVDGRVVTEPGTRIDPATAQVCVDGIVVQLNPELRYFVLNKPRGVVSSLRDEYDRPDLRAFVDPLGVRVFNVGRLDYDTSGLLVLTNDGNLANVLAHPSFAVAKTYVATVRGSVTGATLRQLRAGIVLEDGPIAADQVRVLQSSARGGAGHGTTLVEVTLHSGRNRIVRRMFDAVDHPVTELVRRSFGPLHLGVLRQGVVRELTTLERGSLLTVAAEKRG